MKKTPRTVVYDTAIVVVGIGAAFMLYHFNLVSLIPQDSAFLTYVSSFIAGIFFTSVVTIAPASVALAEFALRGTVWGITFFGALGAMVGDVFILYFLKEHVARDVNHYMRPSLRIRFKKLMKHRVTRWGLALIGAIIVASPLPDELGLALMGMSQVGLGVLAPLSFLLNFIGVYGIVWFAHAI